MRKHSRITSALRAETTIDLAYSGMRNGVGRG